MASSSSSSSSSSSHPTTSHPRSSAPSQIGKHEKGGGTNGGKIPLSAQDPRHLNKALVVPPVEMNNNQL